MIERRDLYLVITCAILLVSVVLGVKCADDGKRDVILQSTKASLVRVEKEKSIIANQRDSIGKELVKASIATEKTKLVYVKTKPVIKGDSVFIGQEFIQVIDNRITKSIQDEQAYIANLERENAAAKFMIKVDTVYIAKDSTEIGLHKSIEKLQSAPRGAWSLQAGAGYCTSPKGGTPCVYVGVGYSVRF